MNTDAEYNEGWELGEQDAAAFATTHTLAETAEERELVAAERHPSVGDFEVGFRDGYKTALAEAHAKMIRKAASRTR